MACLPQATTHDPWLGIAFFFQHDWSVGWGCEGVIADRIPALRSGVLTSLIPQYYSTCLGCVSCTPFVLIRTVSAAANTPIEWIKLQSTWPFGLTIRTLPHPEPCLCSPAVYQDKISTFFFFSDFRSSKGVWALVSAGEIRAAPVQRSALGV
jgi:hypothetical protein